MAAECARRRRERTRQLVSTTIYVASVDDDDDRYGKEVKKPHLHPTLAVCGALVQGGIGRLPLLAGAPNGSPTTHVR